MVQINHWQELIDLLTREDRQICRMLLHKITQFLRPYQRANLHFRLDIVQKNHHDIFNTYKIVAKQLLIENDITDILTEIPSLQNKHLSLSLHMISVGKWIKIYAGNPSRLHFYDEEKTIINDKQIADFLNKVEEIRPMYQYFGRTPIVYYKFTSLPSEDVINHFTKFNVIPILYDHKTEDTCSTCTFSNRVLLDQTMVLTLCSNLSYGLSTSYYLLNPNLNQEMMIQNKRELDDFLQDKELLVNQKIYDQMEEKFSYTGGEMEKERYLELKKRLLVVSDEKNLRFHQLKNTEMICTSVAEREKAIIVTSSQRMCKKIDLFYREMPYKLFKGAQLVESKHI